MQKKTGKKNNITNITFLIIVGIILVFPIVFFNYSETISAEKRKLAASPKIFNDGKISNKSSLINLLLA